MTHANNDAEAPAVNMRRARLTRAGTLLALAGMTWMFAGPEMDQVATNQGFGTLTLGPLTLTPTALVVVMLLGAAAQYVVRAYTQPADDQPLDRAERRALRQAEGHAELAELLTRRNRTLGVLLAITAIIVIVSIVLR